MPIDQQQVEAVKTLKALGFTFAGGTWSAPANDKVPTMLVEAEADVVHARRVLRAEDAVTDAIEAYLRSSPSRSL
jgi:hypothetical protein